MIDVEGQWGRGRVTPVGGCVLSWAPEPHGEQLFVSRDAVIGAGAMWHGGIPVCAPWFGAGQGDWEVPHGHGLVSRVPWRVGDVVRGDDAARISLTVDAADTAHLPGADRYPADLTYRLDIEMGRHLTLSLTIGSPSTDVSVDEAFHPYLAVDATRATVSGLDGVGFRDFAGDATPDMEHGPVRLGHLLDRVYDDYAPVTLSDGRRTLRLSADGAASTVVWNPGPGGWQVGDEWAGFACIEHGNVQNRAVTIPAGGSHTLTLTISPG